MTARLLVAVLEGVGAQDLGTGLTPFLNRARFRAPLRRNSALPPARELLAGGLAPQCRELGLEVEQRSIVLRPAWRGDAAVLQQLGVRPRGAADLTFLRLVDVARTAAAAGCGSHATAQALAELDTQLGNLAESLARRGERPEVALLCVGPMLSTTRTFDPSRLLRMLPDLLRRQLRWRMSPGALLIECDSVQAEAHLRELLSRHPFDGHGRLAEDGLGQRELRPGQLLLLAADEVAFGRGSVRARMRCLPCTSADDGVALLPWMEPGEATIPRIAAQILARGEAMAEALCVERQSRSVAAAANIDAVLEHDPLQEIEH